ncbi:uncharacterized protein LOC131677055 isoform X2 [Topomyia yanbarensis]|uniref:uncharacterized protein LOC131677055 isoform X2 n=1 Tax=Topomyia yanbarensis TaxID=2498891 RepID=UPI00273ADBF5|nr:uncharacterized protein LOC131677055 isoform X2 [Topomyia yanbarensis]
MAPRSNIWMYFTKGVLSGECNECGATIKTMGNTMNMWNHLQRRHPREYAMARGQQPAEFESTDHDPLAAEVVVEATGTVLEDGSFQMDINNTTQHITEESLDEIKHLPKSTPVRSTKMAQVKRRLTCPEHVSPKFSSPTSNRHSTTAGGEQQSVQKVEKPDSFQVFGNFVAEELRKIPDLVLANQVQRKLNRYLMDCMDEVDAAYCHQSISNN